MDPDALREAVEKFEAGWTVRSGPTVLAAARAVLDFCDADVNRSDAVLDWAETHLAHYDWETALACIDQLLAHLRTLLLTEEAK